MNLVNEATIKILSWNLFLIPDPLNLSRRRERIKDISSFLSTQPHDIFLFQECFGTSAGEFLKQNLSSTHPFSIKHDERKKYRHVLNSGLLILSRQPIRLLQNIVYAAGSHADQFAAKGAHLIELDFASLKLQIANTHLQAWETPRARRSRRAQVTQLNDMLASGRSENTAQILVGDLNIDFYQGDEFKIACEILKMKASSITGDLRHSHGQNKWIDHSLIGGNLDRLNIESTILEIPRSPDDKPLSDHRPVQTVVKIVAT